MIRVVVRMILMSVLFVLVMVGFLINVVIIGSSYGNVVYVDFFIISNIGGMVFVIVNLIINLVYISGSVFENYF